MPYKNNLWDKKKFNIYDILILFDLGLTRRMFFCSLIDLKVFNSVLITTIF